MAVNPGRDGGARAPALRKPAACRRTPARSGVVPRLTSVRMMGRVFLKWDRPVSTTKVLVAAFLSAASACALAADARERGFISLGMAEGEVVFRIGKPDHEAFVLNVKGQPEEKTWTYFPHSRDPQTLTIITLRAGVVANLERKIVR
jgi:hypothetical protein